MIWINKASFAKNDSEVMMRLYLETKLLSTKVILYKDVEIIFFIISEDLIYKDL